MSGMVLMPMSVQEAIGAVYLYLARNNAIFSPYRAWEEHDKPVYHVTVQQVLPDSKMRHFTVSLHPDIPDYWIVEEVNV